MKIQTKVLSFLYFVNRERNLDQMVNGTGLKRTQIIEALRGLTERGLIKKQSFRKEGVFPGGFDTCIAKINHNVIDRIEKVLRREDGL